MRNKKTDRSLKMNMLSAAVLMALSAAAYAAPSKTAQGTYVEFTAPTELAIEQNIQYRFDENIAASFFTNVLVSGPVASCNGKPSICSAAAPAAPSAPLPDYAQVVNSIKDNRCVFLNGGVLVVSNSTYTQSIKVDSWTYTWTYVVTPATTDPIAAKTAWVYDRTLGGNGTADVDVGTKIAGESVVVSSQFPAPGKYSFSLLDSNGVNRVQNLKYTVTDTVSNTVAVTVPGADGVPLLHGPVAGADLLIKNYNGGTNGDSSLLWGKTAPQTLPALMSYILNHDAATNNDNGGAGGLAMSVDFVQPVTFTLPPSTYNINLSGVVKGNSTSADQPFSLTNQVHVTYVGSGCGQ